MAFLDRVASLVTHEVFLEAAAGPGGAASERGAFDKAFNATIAKAKPEAVTEVV